MQINIGTQRRIHTTHTKDTHHTHQKPNKPQNVKLIFVTERGQYFLFVEKSVLIDKFNISTIREFGFSNKEGKAHCNSHFIAM